MPCRASLDRAWRALDELFTLLQGSERGKQSENVYRRVEILRAARKLLGPDDVIENAYNRREMGLCLERSDPKKAEVERVLGSQSFALPCDVTDEASVEAAFAGERIAEARVSTRLKDSAAVLVADEHDISAPLRRALEAAGQQAPAGKPVLELNVDHHLVKYLEQREDEAAFMELALVIYELAMLADGAQLPDPGAFVQRLNRLWMRLQ